MSIQPHLHFEIHNDCQNCCPRILRCFCCSADQEESELVVKRDAKVVAVPKASQKVRKLANENLYNEAIPKKIGKDKWEAIKENVCHMCKISIQEDIEKGNPVTREKLNMLTKAVQDILEKESSESKEAECEKID